MATLGTSLASAALSALSKGTVAHFRAKTNRRSSTSNAASSFGFDSAQLSQLIGALSTLVPLKEYDVPFSVDFKLCMSSSSMFIANVVGLVVSDTTGTLAEWDHGRPLLVFVTMLGCLWTPLQIQGLLTEILARTLEGKNVDPVSKRLVATCTHAGFLNQYQHVVRSLHRKFEESFRIATSKEHMVATYEDIASLLALFGQAQAHNRTQLPQESKVGSNRRSISVSDEAYILVRNLRGMQGICAVLVLFGAKISVGDEPPRFKMPMKQEETYTPIRFVFDKRTEGKAPQPSVTFIKTDGPIHTHIVPSGQHRPALSGTVLAYLLQRRVLRQLQDQNAVAETLVGCAAYMLLVMNASNSVSGTARALHRTTRHVIFMTCWKKMVASLVEKAASQSAGRDRSVSISSGHTSLPPYSPSTNDPFRFEEIWRSVCKAGTEIKGKEEAFYKALRHHHGDQLVDEVRRLMTGSTGVHQPLGQLWAISLLQAVCKGSISGLEIDEQATERFQPKYGPGDFNMALEGVVKIIAAYSQVHHLPFFAAVQCGASVVLPRIFAEERIGNADSRLLTILPGFLTRERRPISRLIPDPDEFTRPLLDIRDIDEPLPADVSDSSNFKYFYTFTSNEECRYWVRAAGHRLKLERLIYPLLNLHHFSDADDPNITPPYAPFSTESPIEPNAKSPIPPIPPISQISQVWRGRLVGPDGMWPVVAPRHSACSPQWRICLSYNNEAGRLLALSNVADVVKRFPRWPHEPGPTVLCHTGSDYNRALEYTRWVGGEVLIL